MKIKLLFRILLFQLPLCCCVPVLIDRPMT